MRNPLHFLLNTNIFIAFAAVVLTYLLGFDFSMAPNNLWYLLTVFSATLFDYNVHRLIKLKTDPSERERNMWAIKHKGWILMMAIFSFLVLVCCLFFLPFIAILGLCISGILTLFYSIPSKYFQHLKFDVKKTPGLKNILIALVWCIVTLLTPHLLQGEKFENGVELLSLLSLFTFLLIITLPFDIRDYPIDMKTATTTIPTQYGLKVAYQTITTLFILLITFTAFELWYTYSLLKLVLRICFLFLLGMVLYNPGLKKRKHYHSLIVDGSIFAYAFLMA